MNLSGAIVLGTATKRGGVGVRAIFLSVAFLLLAAHGFASDYTSGLACSADGKQVFLTRLAFNVFARSTNYGVTWQTNVPPEMGAIWYSFACSADGTKLVAGTYNKIYTSLDSGQTWNGYDVPPGAWKAAAWSADGSQLLVACVEGFVLTSTNAGINWKTNDLPAWSWVALAASADGNSLVAAAEGFSSGLPGGVFTSTNGGTSWFLNNLPSQVRWLSVACSADGRRLAASVRPLSVRGVFLSTNGGLNWINMTNGPPHGAVRCSSDGSTLVGASIDRLYRSTNFGHTWTHTSPTNILFPMALATSADANRVYVRAADSGSDQIESRQFPVNPTLKLFRPSESALALSWTVPSSNFIVERAFELSPTNWVDAGVTPNLTNYDYQVVLSSNVSSSSAPQYFRLRSIP